MVDTATRQNARLGPATLMELGLGMGCPRMDQTSASTRRSRREGGLHVMRIIGSRSSSEIGPGRC